MASAFARMMALLLAAVACGPSKEQIAAKSADSIVAIATREGLVYRGSVGGRPVALMVHDCKVNDLNDAPGKGGRRPTLLQPEFYPWPTVCSRQSITSDSAWVTVVLGRTGLGAGGCCAAGGTYRSRDGRVWEREGERGTWTRVGTDSTP